MDIAISKVAINKIAKIKQNRQTVLTSPFHAYFSFKAFFLQFHAYNFKAFFNSSLYFEILLYHIHISNEAVWQ